MNEYIWYDVDLVYCEKCNYIEIDENCKAIVILDYPSNKKPLCPNCKSDLSFYKKIKDEYLS